jgi:hypothetical protein
MMHKSDPHFHDIIKNIQKHYRKNHVLDIKLQRHLLDFLMSPLGTQLSHWPVGGSICLTKIPSLSILKFLCF